MPRRLGIVERHTGQMLELDEHDGAVQPVVEGVGWTRAAHPRKPRFVEMADDFVHLHLGVCPVRPPNVYADRVRQAGPLCVRESVGSDTAVWDHRVIAERTGNREVVDRMAQVGWDCIRHDRRVLDRNLLLIRIERTDEIEAAALLDIEHSNSVKTTGSTVARFRTHENRRHRHLVADNDAIDREMVPVELESPWRVGRGSAKE